jgi:hypothetical protein
MIVGWKRAEDGLYVAGMQAPWGLPWAPAANPVEVSSSRHPMDGVGRSDERGLFTGTSAEIAPATLPTKGVAE